MRKFARALLKPVIVFFKKVIFTLSYIPLFFKYLIIRKNLKNKIGRETIKVGFIGYLDGPSCDIFTDLYKIFEKDPNFECKVVVVPYTHDNKTTMIQKYKKAFDYVKEQGIIPLPGYDFNNDVFYDYSDNFDITFFEIEYDWVHPFFLADNFKNSLSFILPYGQYLADDIDGHFSCRMMSRVFRIIPPSKAVGKMMRKYSYTFGWNVCKEFLGNPKIDKFFDANIKYNDVWIKSKSSQKRIIWAPHHTWAQYSNFHTYSDFFLNYARSHQDDVFIALKPHPALKDSLSKIDGWSDARINEYFECWRNGENTDLFEGAWFDLFKTSDAMIMDSIAFMLEYSLTGKPSCVLYKLDSNGKRLMKFSECGEEIYELLDHAKNEDEIERFIDMIQRGKDDKSNLRNNYIKINYLPPYGCSAVQNIYNSVLRLLE